jgi:HEAT repeat protein
VRPARLTFIAEDLAHAPSEYAVPYLRELLSDESSLVREGAIYGAVAHLEMLELDLRRIAAEDLSGTIRQIAREALEGA